MNTGKTPPELRMLPSKDRTVVSLSSCINRNTITADGVDDCFPDRRRDESESESADRTWRIPTLPPRGCGESLHLDVGTRQAALVDNYI